MPEMTPARLIVSPGGSELLTTSYQTYGFPGDVQPEPSSDSISISYSCPTEAVGHLSTNPPPAGSVQSAPEPASFSKSAAAAPLTATAAKRVIRTSASFMRIEPRILVTER